MFWTRMISDGAAGSPTWNWVDDTVDALGQPVFEATVHVSGVKGDGASLPPEMTVVEGLFSKTSVATDHRPGYWCRGIMGSCR